MFHTFWSAHALTPAAAASTNDNTWQQRRLRTDRESDRSGSHHDRCCGDKLRQAVTNSVAADSAQLKAPLLPSLPSQTSDVSPPQTTDSDNRYDTLPTSTADTALPVPALAPASLAPVSGPVTVDSFLSWRCSEIGWFYGLCAINFGCKGIVTTTDAMYSFSHANSWADSDGDESYDAGIYYMIFGLVGASMFIWMQYLCRRLGAGMLLVIGCGAMIAGAVCLNGFGTSIKLGISFTQLTFAMSLIYGIGFPICQTMLIVICSRLLIQRHNIYAQSTLLSLLDSAGSAACIIAPAIAGYLYSCC